MPRKGKAAQAREDAAWLASMQPQLPMEQAPRAQGVKTFATVPEACPKCDKAMRLASGWALVFGDLLQCGGCAYTIEVPRSEYERYAKALHDHFDRLKQYPKPKRQPKQRGAG